VPGFAFALSIGVFSTFRYSSTSRKLSEFGKRKTATFSSTPG
jgi:hypothetical protein